MNKFGKEKFEIVETRKLGGSWEQELVVVRLNEAYLRLTGNGTDYRVMTATAGESAVGLKPCKNQARLLEAAALLARNQKCFEGIEADGKGREYVQLFTFSQEEGETDEDFTEDLYKLVDSFFEIYDGLEERFVNESA
jgi:hypothetical protein